MRKLILILLLAVSAAAQSNIPLIQTGGGTGGGSSLPTASAANQVPVSTGPGTSYNAAFLGVIPRANTLTTDTILASDRNGYVSESNGSTVAVTLPQSSSTGFTINFAFVIKNIGAGLVTITPTVSTIDGVASVTIPSQTGRFIYSDNTNYFSIPTGTSLADVTDNPGTSVTVGVPLILQNGTNTTPSIKFGTTGVPFWFYTAGTGNGCFVVSGDTCDIFLQDQGQITLASGGVGFGGSSSANNAVTTDSNISRTAAATWAIGSGAAASEAGFLRWNTCKPTSAANMTVSGTAVTICTWTLPSKALTWSWQCKGTYTTTTNTDTFAIGINAAQAPTSETGTAFVYSTNTGTLTSGTASGTSAGALNLLTGASVSAVTNIPWESYGTIQASATGGTFVITGTLTGTSPSGTVNVGSTCELY